MLRVLTLSTLFPDASRPNFGVFVERQIEALAKRGDIEVRVIAPVGIPPWPLSRLGRFRVLVDLPRHEIWRGIEVHRPTFVNLPATGGRLHARMVARAALPVAAAIREQFPFDLITGDFFYPAGPAAVALARHFGVPSSITARGSDIHYWGKAPGVAAQVLAAGRAASGMLAVSEAIRDDMIALGMPGDRIQTNMTGVNLTRFVPRDRAATKRAFGLEGPLVVSLGALIPLKGHYILIDAMALLPGVQLRIAGQGPERDRLQARIDRAGLGDRVKLLGGVPHDEVPALVAAADVMALASEREGLANAWLEAMACGTPVVIPDVGGATQVLRMGAVAGRLAPRTAQGFAEAIAATLAQPPDQMTVREVVASCSWEANSARLHAYYSRLVAEHAGERREGT